MSFDKHASIFASAVFLDSAHKKSLSGENASIDLFIAGLYAKKGFSSSSNTSSPSSNGATQDLVRGLEQVLDKQKEHETQEKLNALNKVIANGIAETDTFIVSLDTESATTDMQEMFVSILFYFSMMCGSEKTLKTHKIGNVGGFEQPIRRNQARLIKALSDYDLPSIDGIKLEMSKFISILYQTYLLEDSRFMSPGTGIDYSKPIARVQVMPDTWHNLSRDYDGEELYPMTDDQVEEAYQLNLQRIKNLKLFAQDNQPFIDILHDAGFLVEELSENLHKHLAIPQYMFILFNYWGLDNELFERLKRAFSGYYTGSLDDSLANDKDFLDVSREHRLKHNKEQRDKAEAARVIKINKMIKIGSVIGFLIIASIYYFI